MAGWRQWRLGRRKTLPNKTKIRLDSDRPSHGRRFHSLTAKSELEALSVMAIYRQVGMNSPHLLGMAIFHQQRNKLFPVACPIVLGRRSNPLERGP
jgi:hypothetical protein